MKSDVRKRVSPSNTNNTFQEGAVGTPSCGAVTSQEVLDGYREKTMRVANVENTGCQLHQQEHST